VGSIVAVLPAACLDVGRIRLMPVDGVPVTVVAVVVRVTDVAVGHPLRCDREVYEMFAQNVAWTLDPAACLPDVRRRSRPHLYSVG